MSADAWRVCPKCKHRAEVARNEKIKKADAAYGRITPDEWKRMNDDANKPIKLGETFREDYEILMDESGEFSIRYSGRCTKCGWGHEFDHSECVEV